MAGRRSFTWRFALVATLASASIASAGSPTSPVPGESILRARVVADLPLTIWADDLFHWTDGTEEIYALHGENSFVGHGGTELRAGRAIVWIDAAARKQGKPFQVIVYADEFAGKPVRLDRPGEARQTAPTALIEFTTSAIGQIRGQQREESLAESRLYRRACAARGKPIAGPEPARPGIDPATFRDLLGAQDEPKKVEPNTVIPVPISDTRTVWIMPRSGKPFAITPLEFGQEKVIAVTGGIQLQAKFATGSIRSLMVEADQAIIWRKEGDSSPAMDAMRSNEGSSAEGLELYLSGNVIIRYGSVGDTTGRGIQKQSRTLRADRIYYDVDNHKAIALQGDLEYTKEGFLNTAHVVGREIWQLSETEFKVAFAEIHASRLPSDPGIKLTVESADIYREPRAARTGLFGAPIRDRVTGDALEEDPEILEARGVRTLVRDVPLFYWPFLRADVNDPFGPLDGVAFRQDRQFGTQIYTTFDVLELLGRTKMPNEKWQLLLDFLSDRGPAIGTNYTLRGQKFMGMDAPFETLVKGYLIHDKGRDILAGARQDDFQPSDLRGRFMWRHQQDFLDHNLTLQSQIALLSDRNFYEQYYKFDYDLGPNQETFLWLKWQEGQSAATFLLQPDAGRSWVTETYWLPRVDAYRIGQSIFERFTYHTWCSLAYARLDPFRNPGREFPLGFDNFRSPRPEEPVETGRVDWMQQIAMPIDVGPAKVVPYAVLDVAAYSQNSNHDPQGRLYGGVGTRASVPLSKLYPEVQSELFNLQGLYHKNLFSANYFVAASTAGIASLPQLDRLNDDATEAANRNVTPWHPFYEQTMGAPGNNLSYSPLFNPRLYALRRLVDSKPDNLEDIHVAQLDWRQRFQTKRGYPGLEHEIDWLTFDLSASIFPTKNRDNFGSTFGFLEYQMVWNVGDRTGVYSSGWLDPIDFGAKYCQVGTFFSRDDRTSFNLAYRYTDPIHSRIVSASANYIFGPKYAMTAVTAYDFGSRSSLSNTFLFTRIGTDMQITIGFTYNYLINTFGFTFNIVPNLIANQQGPGRGASGVGGGQFQDRR